MSLQKNIARGTTDPGIASLTWIISPATNQANSVESKILVKFGHKVAFLNEDVPLDIFSNAK